MTRNDADELIKYLKENSFPSQYGNRILIKDVIHKINAMVEPKPAPKLFKPGEIDPDVKCHRCGDMGWIDEISGIPRPCPECRGKEASDV